MGPLEQRYQRRVDRERRARVEAEDLLEAKSRELYETNQKLLGLAADLEQRVSDRTYDLMMAEQQAISLAERDQLTGIANRMLFTRMLEAMVARAGAAQGQFALLLIDLDNFKDVNDGFGHEAGDVVLRAVAARLSEATRGPDIVARLGGDEFAAVLGGAIVPHDLLAIADRMIKAVRRPVAHGEHMLEVSCSIGIAVYPDHAADSADLQRYADLALYRSKAAGRTTATLFSDGLRAEHDERHSLGSELKGAIHAGLVEPFFQPIVDARTQRIVGVESLARWRHPQRGLIMPGLFLGLAEERKLVGDLFTSMLRATCLATRPWLEAGLIHYVSINVSPSQFLSGLLPEILLMAVKDMGFPADALVVEITEEVLLHDLGRARVQLERVAEGGVRIALDDFGVGYSNIAYLRRLPIHMLKLDRQLTVDVAQDPKARSIVGAIIEIARALDLDVVAEGIEVSDQATWLNRLGCHSLQGYLFGRPVARAAFEQLLRCERVA